MEQWFSNLKHAEKHDFSLQNVWTRWIFKQVDAF